MQNLIHLKDSNKIRPQKNLDRWPAEAVFTKGIKLKLSQESAYV